MRVGLPLSYLSAEDADSFAWRENFIRTIIERDLRNLGIGVAHYHGQRWNPAELAGALGVSAMTTRRHLDLLTGPSWSASPLADKIEVVAIQELDNTSSATGLPKN